MPGEIAVTYSTATRVQSINSAATTLRAVQTADLDYSQYGFHTRILNVGSANVSTAMAKLRSVAGVQSVSQVSYRHRMSITANDPYYVGFNGAAGPYYEAAQTPGQWDMHVINVQGGWNAVASGSAVTGAPIAIVDTGVDVTHPELTGGKIVRTECFVTYPTGSTQSTSIYVTDTDGHGTNVAGIADADTNNSFGFASVAFGAQMMAYRIFPTDPAGGCDNSSSAQCNADTADEASAIMDAVNHGAKVINLSLGGAGPCSSSDPEYTAVEYAITHNVVVVAAAGNETTGTLDCPAADPGVIAVGASALNDSGTTITEKVASYSNYLLTNGNGYYLVAPGGDPTGGSDNDDLHWIENTYSSTSPDLGSQACTPEFGSSSSAVDCRILIAGTSQATPHVVGAVSLILAVKPNYTPAQVAAALCNSTDNINDPKQGCGRLNVGNAVNYALTH